MTDGFPAYPMTAKQVGEIYGMSARSVLREREKGRLKGRHKRGEHKRWYFTADDVKEWIEKGMFEE